MMKKLRNSTKQYEYLVDKLDAPQQKAVFMRLLGKDETDIALELKVTYTTVRGWFQKNRPAEKALSQLKKERAKENRKAYKKLDSAIQEAAPAALETLKRVGKYNWKAAESLIHIAGYLPVQRIKQEGGVNTIDEMTKALIELKNYADKVTDTSAGDAEATPDIQNK